MAATTHSESPDLAAEATSSARADYIGVLCSVGCAIHCAATPLLLAALPSITSVRWLADPLFHQIVAVICGFLVIRAILPGWRIHKDVRVATLAAAGVGLLFVAAFILPDKCCDLDHPTSGSQAVIASGGKSESDEPTSNVAATLVSMKSRVAVAGLGKSPIGHDHGGHDHSHDGHDHSGHAHAHNHSAASAEASESCQDCETCSVDDHAATWSRPLLSAETLETGLGPVAATRILALQPYLSPLGGLLLIAAHIMNIRLRCCTRGSC